MSGMVGTTSNSRPSCVRMFLRADSAEKLVRLQLLTNTRLRGRAEFTDIQFADGRWYAWFLVDLDQYPELMGEINGTVPDTRRPRTGKV